MKYLIAVSLLLLSLFAPTVQARQQPTTTITVRAGYDGDGLYHVNHWFPVGLIVSNDGADLQAVVEWRFLGESQPAFRYELDLPRGARKQLSMAITSLNSKTSAVVTLSANGTGLAESRVQLNPVNSNDVLIGVLSSDNSLLNSLAAAEFANTNGTTVTHLDPTLMPDSAALLAGLQVIIIHDLAGSALSEAQRAALELWTQMGGQLVVSGGPLVDRTVPALGALLPVDVGALQPDTSLDGLATLARRNDQGATLPRTTANAVTLRSGARELDRDGLLVVRPLGAGQVIFARFDLAATRAWGGEADLWERVLKIGPRIQIAASYRQQRDNLLSNALDLSVLDLPSTSLLLLLMATYIIVIGPLNFLTLRWLKRIELAWITTPLLVLLFLGGAYSVSLVLRGTTPQLAQLSFVQGFEGLPHGQATAFIGIFSPQRRAYRVDMEPTSLITPASFESFDITNLPVTSDGLSNGIRDMLIDVSSLRTILVEAPAEVPPVVSSLQLDSGTLQGELRLGAGAPTLHDALIVQRAATQNLGELKPGQAISINLAVNQENFPGDFQQSTGPIDHWNALNNLFGYDRFNLSGPGFGGGEGIPDQGIYLLGWASAPLIPTQINGTTIDQQGETLYLIRLDQ